MNKIIFFYDESAHSRRLTSNTINSNNFEPFFCTAIFGIDSAVYCSFKNDFLLLESKWKVKFGIDGELKSTVIKQKKYKYGFYSMNKLDIDFYNDFFDMLIRYKKNIYLHFGLISKIEYLIRQFNLKFKDIENRIINKNSVYYILAKSLCVYHPDSVINDIINSSDSLISSIKSFLNKRRNLNKRKFGFQEEIAFSALENYIDSIDGDINIDWNYCHSFIGFKKFIFENNVNEYEIYLDKEGIGDTFKAAEEVNLKNIKEVDSKDYEGIRCADVLAGFLNNIINSFNYYLYYDENEEGQDARLLPKEWFDLNESCFSLYKKAFNVIINVCPCFNKASSLVYADGLIYFNALLNYFNSYSSYNDYKEISLIDHQIRLNKNAVLILNYFYETFVVNNWLFTEDEDLSFQLLYDVNNKNFFDNVLYHKKLQLPKEGETLKYVFLSLFIKESINKRRKKTLIRYFKISEFGKDNIYECPTELYEWFDAHLKQDGGLLFPKMLIINKINGFHIMPYDPDDDVMNLMFNNDLFKI